MVFEQSWWGIVTNAFKNEVSKVWLQKELILVGFWLSQVGWIGLFCLGRNICEKVKSWFLSNFGGEVSQTYAKLAANLCELHLIWFSFH